MGVGREIKRPLPRARDEVLPPAESAELVKGSSLEFCCSWFSRPCRSPECRESSTGCEPTVLRAQQVLL